MTKEEVIKIFRKEIECLSHSRCEDCILEKACNPMRTPLVRTSLDSEYIEAFDMAIKALEQEPCDDVCEWFDQYVDIATDIVELSFSDGTVKRAKRGLYMRDIEKSIREMLIDQIANEKKQESKWIPVESALPEVVGEHDIRCSEDVLVYDGADLRVGYFVRIEKLDNCYWNIYGDDCFEPIAWMPLPEPYKESETD